MGSDMAVEYVRYRRQNGVGSRQAARLAGFSGGTPSEAALELWRAYEDVRDADHESLVADLERIPELEAQLKRLKRRRLAMTMLASG